MKKAYLITYNLIQTLGWSYILLLYIVEKDPSDLWDSIEMPLKIFQTAAVVFEIVHSLLGLVSSGVVPTLKQSVARISVLWYILDVSPPSQQCIGLPILLVAWSISEIVRYGYYFTNLSNLKLSSVFQWLRYSLFIVLYPMGAVGELICAYSAVDYVRTNGIWPSSLAKLSSTGLAYHHLIVTFMVLLLPVFSTLYFHMFSQRKRVLGGASNKKKL